MQIGDTLAEDSAARIDTHSRTSHAVFIPITFRGIDPVNAGDGEQ
jgi:hypothetical protein